jgi:hypothetical protein
MNCGECQVEMVKADITGDVLGMAAYIRIRKGPLEDEKRSAIECLVCPVCGNINLRAATPETMK